MRLILFITVILFGFSANPNQQDSIPAHDTFTIESSNLEETRVINIWTPPGYSESEDELPVLYMLDGGIKEDFPHIANTVAKLVSNKSIPPMILVGIENTERRRDLTGPSEVKADKEIAPISDGASKFRAFISEELFAEVNSRYRTNNSRGIIGESVAGLFIVETLLFKPDMFDYYIAMDPSLWWNNHNLVKTTESYLEKFPKNKVKFWFAGSSIEDISVYTNELNIIMKSQAPSSLIWKYSDEPNEKHNTIFRATKEKALIWVYGTNEDE